jgi:hypothetical protein
VQWSCKHDEQAALPGPVAPVAPWQVSAPVPPPPLLLLLLSELLQATTAMTMAAVDAATAKRRGIFMSPPLRKTPFTNQGAETSLLGLDAFLHRRASAQL